MTEPHADLHFIKDIPQHVTRCNCFAKNKNAAHTGNAAKRNFKWPENGVKDCSGCLVPHGRKSYSYVTAHWNQISEIAKQNR